MSTTELKEQLGALSRAERREIMDLLQGLEEKETQASQGIATVPLRSFEEAMDYTFANFDNVLRKLAQ